MESGIANHLLTLKSITTCFTGILTVSYSERWSSGTVAVNKHVYLVASVRLLDKINIPED